MTKLEIPPISIDDVKDCPGGYIECEICRYGKECMQICLNKIDEELKMNTEKFKVWKEIFQNCPNFAEFISDFYEAYGAKGVEDLVIMYNPNKKKFELGSTTPASSSENNKEE